jgi:hypothetical protein
MSAKKAADLRRQESRIISRSVLFCRKLFARRRNNQHHVQEELSILSEGRNTFTLTLKGKKRRKLKYLASLSSFLFQIRPPEGHRKLIQMNWPISAIYVHDQSDDGWDPLGLSIYSTAVPYLCLSGNHRPNGRPLGQSPKADTRSPN